MKRLVSVLLAGIFLIASPAWAADKVDSLPEVRPTTSGRMDFALAVNKAVAVYGKGEFIDDRVHIVAGDTQGSPVVEIVAIGNRIYLRQGNDVRWVSATVSEVDLPVETTVPEVPADAISLYRIGDIDVRGTATTQYQLQVDPTKIEGNDGSVTALNVDMFIGVADMLIHKFQTTVGGTIEGAGDILIEMPIDFSDINTEIVVGAPPADLVDDVGTIPMADRNDFPGAAGLPIWARPMAAYGLQSQGLIP